MARIRYLIPILIILISISSPFLFANITIYDTPLDMLFDKFNISLISNYRNAYYLNIIDDNINYIQFDNPDNRAQYLIDLRRAIDLGIANKWDDAIRHIEETLIPQSEQWIVLSSQKNIVVDLLMMQQFVYKYNIDYIGIPANFKAQINESIIKDASLDFIKIKIHFSNCFTIQGAHIQDCSTVTITLAM